MSKTISSLAVSLGGNISGLSRSFGAAISPIKALGGAVSSTSSMLGGFAGTALKMTGIGAAVSGAVAAVASIGKGFSMAAEMEQASIAFEVMLGSASKAQTLLGDITSFAASTPFELPGLVSAGQNLLAFGVSQEQIIPTMNVLGDLAMGNAEKFQSLATIYGKALNGKITSIDLVQIAEKGIPIFDQLAKQLGKTKAEVMAMSSDGKIGIADLQTAFKSLTGEGGKFNGMMLKQSTSISGLMSTMKDTIGLKLMGVANTIIDVFGLKGGIQALTAGLGTAGAAVNGFVTRIAPMIKTGFSIWLSAWKAVLSVVIPVVSRVFSFVSSVWGQLVPVVTGIATAVWGAVTTAFNAVYNFVAPIVTALVDVIRTNWTSILTTTTGLVLGVWGVIKSVWNAIAATTAAVWQGIVAVWDWGVSLITGQTGGLGLTVADVFQGIVDAGNWLREQFTLALNVAEFAINNFGSIVELVALESALSLVTFANQAEHLFTQVIPAVADWFANNWKDVFRDLFNFTTTVMSNMAGNIVNVIRNIPKLVKGEVALGDLLTPLTEGFKSSLKELPDIPERQMGELEKSLTAEANALGSKLSTGLSEHLNAKQKEAEDAAKGIADGIRHALDPSAGKLEAPKIGTPEAPKIPPAKMDVSLNQDSLTVTVTPKLGKAVFANSAEAQALRFAVPAIAAGKTGATAPTAAALQQPTTPTATATGAMKDAAQELTKRLLDEALKQTASLTSIAQTVKKLVVPEPETL